MPKLIRTFLNLSKPTRTYLDLLKTIWTYPNLFEPIQTYLNITKQMQTKPSPSCGQKERNNKLRTQTQLLAICNISTHGLQTPSEEIAFTAQPKIKPQSQVFRYGQSIFCLPHRPKISDFLDSSLHRVSVVRALVHCNSK